MNLKELNELQKSIECGGESLNYLIKEKETLIKLINSKDYISVNNIGFSEHTIINHLSFDSSDIDKEIEDRTKKLKILETKLEEIATILMTIKE